MKMSKIPKQFSENRGVVTDEDYEIIKDLKVLIVGLGGLGGNFANNIVRLGVQNLTLVDFDVFDLSNLNRQLFSNIKNIGKAKVDVLKHDLLMINPLCNIEIATSKIQDVHILIEDDFDYIIDAVDNPKAKIHISDLGKKLNIPILHGACAGWYGQVGWFKPGNELIKEIYVEKKKGLEQQLMNPSFTPPAIASIMASEFLKMIKGSSALTINQLLLIDLYNNSMLKTGDVDE